MTGEPVAGPPTAVAALDRLSELAARLLGASASQISLTSDVDLVAGAGGVATREVGEISRTLCRMTAAGEGPLLISRAADDERVSGLEPVVSGTVGAYAGVPIRDEDGRSIGALCVFDPQPRAWTAYDAGLLEQLAPSVLAELDLAAMSGAVHEVEARLTRVLEGLPAGFLLLDGDWAIRHVNAEAEHLLARDRAELLGGDLWALFPRLRGTTVEEHYRTAMSSGEPVTFETSAPPPREGWYEVRAWPGPEGLSLFFLDASARHDALETAERAGRRAQLVADVTTQVSDAVGAEQAVSRLARLLVPELGDWCLVTLVDEDGTLREVGSWHVDAALRDATSRYSSLCVGALSESSSLASAMRGRGPKVVQERATETLAALFVPGETRDLLHELAPGAAAVLPMLARGRPVGLLSLFRDPAQGPFSPADLLVAGDVAARAALTLDNARLYRAQRGLSEELQRSLLTAPPEPDHMQVVVRYAPAAEAAQVGGDWYDAFLQPDGATVLVIGDVVGHDSAAAAAMGQVRSLLRGIAYTTSAGPAEVLTRLDHALQGLLVSTNATAVVARLEQQPDEVDRGITRVRWSNAGHPPPLALHPDGTVSVLTGLEADLLLGIDPTSERVESSVVLDRGATVLLYTDGLVESREQPLEDGLRLLRDLLVELADLPLEELCDQVLARMLPESAEDDVALVAIRLHRQDRPRPIAAGRQRVPPDVPPSG